MSRRLAFALLHALHLLPPALSWANGSRHVIWFASSFLVATAVLWLWEAGGLAKRLLSVALNVCVVCANVLLATSFLIQGVGFNVEFFAHAHWDTARIASVALRPLVIGIGAYMLLTLAAPLMMRRSFAAAQHGNRVVALVAATGLLLNAPAWSFSWHLAEMVVETHSVVWVPKKPLRPMPVHGEGRDGPVAAAQTSLVLIFAESLEDTYSRSDIFGQDLTPALTALEAEGLKFVDMRQVSHTSWTTGALVAAQCSRPMSVPSNLDVLRVFAFGPKEDAVRQATCLGDVLAAHGYQSVLMAGMSLQFGGLEAFHAAHGFGERLGFDELSSMTGPSSQASGAGNDDDDWLLEDDALFALARDKIDELAGSSKPFLLALNTMDTHGPSGFPSKTCGATKGLVAAVRCADKLIAQFIQDVRTTYPSVMVALLSDHLVGPGVVDAEVMSKLAGRDEERRLRFAVWADGLPPPAVVDRPGTHFDVMPTLMDLLELDAWQQHYLGASLLRHKSPWFAHGRPRSLRIVHSLPAMRVLPGDEIAFEADGPTIAMDGHRVLATSKGLQLRNAVFAVELDATGGVVDFHVFPSDTRAPASGADNSNFAAWAEGRQLVGVATGNAYTPTALDGSSTDGYFFAGNFGTRGFVSGPLRRRSVVAMPGAVE